jgi:hypothetical protein
MSENNLTALCECLIANITEYKDGIAFACTLDIEAIERFINTKRAFVICNHRDRCGHDQCGAKKPHRPEDCEPCPFHLHAKCVECVVTATTKP